MQIRNGSSLVLAGLLIPLLAHAQQDASQQEAAQKETTQQNSTTAAATSAPAAVCEDAPGFSDWDFWVGEWQVFSNNEARTLLGSNSITKHYSNCLLKETWVDINGNGGFSVNYYNPIKKEWRQVWVSNGYSIDYSGGLDEQGRMVLEGEIYNYTQGTTAAFRGVWTPEGDGDVIQRFESFNSGTREWDLWFEGRYVRQ